MVNRSSAGRRSRLHFAKTMFAAIGTAAWMLALVVRAQVPAVKFDVKAARGLLVSPVYEGWYEHDGTKYVLFGYYNRNLEEIVDAPVGPDNHIAPGPADQGQPTRFFPGRHYGVFAIAAPKDPAATEITWTVTANGQTLSIPASLDRLFFVSPQREDGGPYPGNTPPVLRFDQAGPAAQGPLGVTVSRTATVSRPLAVDVWVTDDGLPPLGEGPAPALRGSPGGRLKGLALTWRAYRGSGAVSFSNPSPPVEQGKARTTVTFSRPGEYTLHLTAIDSLSGTKCCWTNGYVRVTVTPDSSGR
jgi:hypothetical protein